MKYEYNHLECSFVKISNEKELQLTLEEFDIYFSPRLSEKKSNFELYSKKLFENGVTYLYMIGNQKIGFISLYLNLNYIYITLIAVRQEYQKNKIGRKLLKYIEKISEELKINEIKLEVDKSNFSAKKFYQNNGYIFEYENTNSIFMKKICNREGFI